MKKSENKHKNVNVFGANDKKINNFFNRQLLYMKANMALTLAVTCLILLLSFLAVKSFAATAPMKFNALADTYISQSAPKKEFHSAADLRVRGTANYREYSYVRFSLSGIAAKSATIKDVKLHIYSLTTTAGPVADVYNLNLGYPGGYVTWATQPSISAATKLGSISNVASGSWYDIDLKSSSWKDGYITLLLVGTGSEASFGSLQSTTPASLVFSFQDPVPVPVSVPPTITFTQQPLASSTGTTATFKWTVNSTAPVTATTCQLDNQTPTSCAAEIIYSNLIVGSHKFTIVATAGVKQDGTPNSTALNYLFTVTAPTGSTGSGTGTTYYVSPAGSDTNDGKAADRAWRTITKVNSIVIAPGENVLFQGDQTFIGELTPNGSGVSGNPTFYGSYGSGKAVISAGSSVGISLGNQHNVTLNNLIVDGRNSVDCVRSRVTGSGSTAIVIDAVEVRNCKIGIHDEYILDEAWTVKNSYIHDTSDSGMILWAEGSTRTNGNMVIADNTFNNTGSNASLGYGSHGIYSKSPGIKILRNNIGNFSKTLGNAVSSRYRNALIEGNYFHDGPHAIAYYNYDVNETAGMGTSTVRNNRFWNITGYGMILDGEKCGIQASGSACVAAGPENWRIYNNTFGPGSVNGCAIDNRAATTSTELLIKNNVFTGTWSYGQLCLGRKPPNFAEDHNEFAASGGSAGTGIGDITAVPSLTAAPAFYPLSGSKSIDSGTASVNGASFNQICDGQALHYCGAAPDIGAVEYL